MQWFRGFSKFLGVSFVVTCTLGTGVTVPARGAEQIQFFVGPFEPTIYVEDLETFALEGTIPDRLQPIANRFDETQLESVRSLLNTPFEIDLIAVSQFSYGPVGEVLLQRAGQVVLTDSFGNGFHALRASLLLAASAEEDCCTVLDLLNYYPLETIQLDLFLALQVLEENRNIFQLRDEVVAGVRAIAMEQVEAAGIISLPEFAPHQPGPYRWQQESFPFQNPGRSVSSVADLYLPILEAASSSEIPVVVISHGLASDRQTFAYLAEHLVSHGYGVVMLEHAETSAEKFDRFLRGLEGPPTPTELVHRPRDITAAL
ncbi:MAG: alpha/beta hydrolase, partial [Leptolyngbya sp. SIO1D8]|nr:alpha/beta hydrolase [Leptolyngbya sp. SIO1D8]